MGCANVSFGLERKRAGSASGSEIHDIMEEDEEDVVEDEDEEKDSEESQGEEQGEDEQSEANSATESPGPRRRGRPRKARAKKKTGKKASPAMRSTDRREKAHSGSDKNREQSAKDAESESALFGRLNRITMHVNWVLNWYFRSS